MHIRPANAGMGTQHDKQRPIYALGAALILICEYVLRLGCLPKQPSGFQVGNIILIEWLAFVVLIVGWMPHVERLTLRSIGWGRIRLRHIWAGLGAYILVTFATMLSGFVWRSVGLDPISALQPVLKTFGLPVLIGLFVTGTFLEEFIYRGYLIERLLSLTNSIWIAGMVSWLSFTLVHLGFFGLGPMLDVSIISATLVILYLRHRSIWPCVVLHGMNNAMAYLIFPLLAP